MADDKSSKPNRRKALSFSALTSVFFYTAGAAAVMLTPLKSNLILMLLINFVFALLIGVLTYWLFNRIKGNKKEASNEAEIINKRRKLLIAHFNRMQRLQQRKRRFHSKYDHPIYLMLSSKPAQDRNIITQMGYEAYKVDDFGNDIEFPILFWLGEHSTLISISREDDQRPEYLKTLCKCLNKWRPRQAINGILVTTEASFLLENSETISNEADQIKSQVKTYNHAFGLNLPVYNIVTNMGSISDFCQFFSAFDESKRDDVFGATFPFQKHGGIDANWFNDEYDHLISQLIASTSNALSGQLNQEFRNSIASAPFQFGLLKQNLWAFLQRMYRGEQLSNGLFFRGFYFTHNGQEHPQNDVLASTVNHSLGNETFTQYQQIPIHQTLFAQRIMSHVVLNEHEIAGVNKRKENILILSQVSFTLFWVLLLAGVLMTIKLDFDFQSRRDSRADTMLERYKESISASPYDIENLEENIPNLYSLYRIYDLYRQPLPWYAVPIILGPSIKKEVEHAYFSELQAVLLPSMENMLEKDLFVYVNLEDQSKTLALLNDYRLLFNPDRTNIEELKSYFINALQDQGDADTVSVAQLKALLDDVFANDLVPKKPNMDLEKLAKKVINQTGIETLLYDHIIHSPKYANRIDIRKELGTNFDQLFSFSSNYVGYFVPYLYTPTGFNDLDLSVDSPAIQDALQAYEGVAGTAPSAIEMYRISRDLRQMYQNDYINYWRNFVNNVKVKPIKNPSELNNAINLLANTSDNPMTKLLTVVNKYTSVELAMPKVQKTEGEKQAAKEALQQDQDSKRSARQITVNFRSYHTLMNENSQNMRPIDGLMKSITKAKTWLDKFYTSEEPEKLAFQTLSATLKVQNPISTLAKSASGQPTLVNTLLTDVTQQSNDMVMSLAHDYLNSSWNASVYKPYQQTIKPFYPFDKKSKVDASVADVKAFFGTEGILNKFYNTTLKNFSFESNKTPYLPGLLPNSGLALAPKLWTMLDKSKDIRKALFLSDPNNISIRFQMKAVDMSPSITEFSISTDKPIFTYRHGPTLWSQQSWQGESQLEDLLSVDVSSQSKTIAKESYQGNWNWFRLIEPRVKDTTAQDTQVEFDFGKDKVRLAIKTQGRENPFVPGFFSAFNLPSAI
ncbi:type VI secretion system membrane subunit TssM [Vibrio sp. S4M6]|uniref:type VI secretion system membrane subunit TssM n=1 Tax=Vibrio sinus TaxID=2946865 RepID=UPI00202A0C9D|nr:type VI secretion system membrane subunit TssM [Vibrio sinus]MCL9783164.1 type VI secretion system membrane subunit TssM [Vibrio sinus]